jgi:hypothetical protein
MRQTECEQRGNFEKPTARVVEVPRKETPISTGIFTTNTLKTAVDARLSAKPFRATAALLVYCVALVGTSQAHAAPFTATFYVPESGRVQLDFFDERNFRLTSYANRESIQNETIIVDGTIYLLLPPRPPFAETNGLLRIGALVARPANAPTFTPTLRITRTPTAVLKIWQINADVKDASLSRAGPIGVPIEVTLARHPMLARAQFAIHQTLRPAMDMSLCGDGINNLTAWWSPDATGAGYAILATTAGVRLDGAIRPLDQRPALPASMPVHDYRPLVH